MTITIFLGLSILFISILIVFCIIERTGLLFDAREILNPSLGNTKNKVGVWVRCAYFCLFAILACASISMAKTYIFPNEKNKDNGKPYFSNVRYHVLAHDGYLLNQHFFLAHGITQQSEGFPQEALWDNKDGEVLLDRLDSAIYIKQFTDPIYVRKYENNRKNRKNYYSYNLVNQVIPEDVSKGFTLSHQGIEIYRMEIIPEKKKCLFVSIVNLGPDSCIRDTSSFNQILTEGYPVLDIIAKSPRIDITEQLEQALLGCYIVRKSILMKGNMVNFDKRHPAPLVLMPGQSFYTQNDFAINNTTYQFDTTFCVRFKDYATEDKLTFYSGIGTRKCESFVLTYPDSTHMQLDFLLQDKHQLREMDGRVFITSSIDAIADDAREGGYLFNKFMWNDNFNHINANIRYKVGSAQDSLRFAVLDLNDQLTGDRKEFHSDERFYLKTSNRTPNAIQWIFEIKNMRDSNDLKMQHFVLFALLMLFAVLLRLGVDSFFNLQSLSLFEFGVYVVLFSLAMVRLLLGWRASTFPPIENIPLPIYLKMRQSIFDWSFHVVWMLPIFITLYSSVDEMGKRKFWWKRFQNWREKKWNNLVEKCKNMIPKSLKSYINEYTIISLIFIAFLIAFFLLPKVYDSLSRLCNIVLPLFCYFLTELWLENRLQKHNARDEKAIRPHKILHFILILGFLFIADAGFTIVFVAYLLLFEGALRGLFSGGRHLIGWNRWKRYIISASSFIALYLILHWEGQIMISIFRYTEYYVIAGSLLLVGLLLLTKPQNKLFKTSKWVLIAGMTFLTISGVIEATSSSANFYKDLVNEKAHMRYRAEIQQLGKNEKIDNIISKSNFASNDIIYIMRSAHNQWFINQYIRAGKKLENSNQTFHIQPHSNQGSPYPTQTTDLVVTRYILAEHGERAAKFILFLWLLLLILSILEVEMSSRVNLKSMAPLTMIFAVSLLVYLSATNRVVFIGQDFPMISIQSRIATLFPLLLITIPLLRSIYLRKNKIQDKDDNETDFKCVIYGILLGLFTMFCFKTIEQKGKDQHESQFNVSSLIQSMSDVVNQINDQFVKFQRNTTELKKKRILSVWEAYRKNAEYGKIYDDMCDSIVSGQFVASSLRYFDNNQISKTDVNQLLHLRRREGICYLAINKRHYFIPAIMEEEERWTGDLYAAYLDPNYTIFGLNNADKIKLNENVDYETNILRNDIVQNIPNLPLMRFDSEWIPGDAPLMLLSSKQGISTSEYFCIELDTLEIKSNGNTNQLATAILPGDVFSLNKIKNTNEGKVETIYSAQLREDGINYIARNIWLNGHRRLFYPLGKESMWSYHYANLVSAALGDSTQQNYITAYKDTSIQLSIDYDLTKDIYSRIQREMKNQANLAVKSDVIRHILENFRDEKENIQTDSIHLHKGRPIFYDKRKNRIKIKNPSLAPRGLASVVDDINTNLKANSYSENVLSDAINSVLQRPYDFTCVAIDGDGHIRLLFDYTQRVRIDPNNIQHLSKLISELYIDGSAIDERDLFGNKALQYIPMGPGSSFKPIAFTAITSKEALDWKSITLSTTGLNLARHITKKGEKGNITTAKFDFYGGIDVIHTAHEKPLSLDLEGKYKITDYLIQSDNLVHSLVIMFGLQPIGYAKNILRDPPSDDKLAFPVFEYRGRRQSFDPTNWYNNGNIIKENSLLEIGLYENFRIPTLATRTVQNYVTNFYGQDSISQYIYNYPSSAKGWSFAERSSQNTPDRKQKPILRNGLNQMVLGASPLQQTALQMAVNASRLVSLNNAEQITTLMDGPIETPFNPFSLGGGWTEQSYLSFVRDVVWAQLHEVARTGTANGLSKFSRDLENGKYGKPYYLYCKTGTLDDERKNREENRIKHLLVIVSDKKLETVQTMEELKKVRYYAMYISYLGVEKSGFHNSRFQPYIQEVINSATFKSYMNPQN